jgi:hypothetical protein
LHFYFGRFDSNIEYLDLPILHSLLLVHKETLRSVNIRYLPPRGRGRLFIASDFPELEILGLSRWQMEKDLEFSDEQADALLGPRLQKFVWDFVSFLQPPEYWTEFGNQEEDWLEALAKAAFERKSALRTIEIAYRPNQWKAKEGDSYPWDRLDQVQLNIRQYGISLVYDEPCYSREEWSKATASWPTFNGTLITNFFPRVPPY